MWAIAYAWQDRFAVFEIRQHTVVIFHVSMLVQSKFGAELRAERRSERGVRRSRSAISRTERGVRVQRSRLLKSSNAVQNAELRS